MVQAVQKIGSEAKLRLERARARSGVVDVVVRTFKRYSADDCGFYAASLTYYAFFSIFPLLLFSAAVLGYITFISPNLREDILTAGLDAFPLLDSVLTPATLDRIQEQRGSLAIVAAILALYAGSGGIVALQHSFNRISGVQEEPGFVPKRLRSLGWLAILGLSALVSVGLGAIASFAGALFGDVGLANEMTALVGHAVGFLVGVWIFLSAFKFLPKPQKTWREVLPGALLAAGAFELLKVAGTWYLERGAATRQATFGAFAAAAGLLVVAYLLAQVTLLAFELNQVLQERKQMRRSTADVEGGTGG